MAYITSSDAKELFWSEIGVSDKFKPQHAKFMKYLESHDTVTHEDVMHELDTLISELTPNDFQPRRVLMSQPGAR